MELGTLNHQYETRTSVPNKGCPLQKANPAYQTGHFLDRLKD